MTLLCQRMAFADSAKACVVFQSSSISPFFCLMAVKAAGRYLFSTIADG